MAVWVLTVLVIPRIGVMSAGISLPSEGKIITDMRMNEDLRKLGDGHNASDPAFNKLKTDTLKKYNVDKIEDLPVNYRGIVASNSEAKLTETLNEYAEKRMQREAEQAAHLSAFGWVSPYLAVSGASRNLAGTDLSTHHRFLRDAEALRFEFVQGLNKAHIEVLSYQDDINRNKSEEAFNRTRIDPENWQVLQDFRFTPDPAKTRVERAIPKLIALILWLLGLLTFGFVASRRLTP
jgi:ABC-2 type transport system permease protein